jgi:uncharacterized membrane protein
MNVSIKYGGIIAIGVIVWVLISNYIFHPDPNSGAASFTVLFFNVLPIVCLYLGINEKRKATARQFVIGQGVATGLSIMAVYIVIASLFFIVMGPRLLAQQQAGPEQASVLQHLAGFIFFALIGGLFYSALISFVIKRFYGGQPEHSNE